VSAPQQANIGRLFAGVHGEYNTAGHPAQRAEVTRNADGRRNAPLCADFANGIHSYSSL